MGLNASSRCLSAGFSLFFLLLRNVLIVSAGPKEGRITEITMMNSTTLRLSFNNSVDTGDNCHLTIKLESGSHTYGGNKFEDSNETFVFHIQEDPFCRQATITFSCTKEIQPTYIAGDSLDLKCMNNQSAAVVRQNGEEKTAYLRFSCLEEDRIDIGDQFCSRDTTPCYFKVADFVSGEIKWCVSIPSGNDPNNKVKQCSTELAPFNDIPDDKHPLLMLYGDGTTLGVIHELDEPILEVLVLDVDNGSILASETGTECEAEENGIHNCTAVAKFPPGKREVQLLVVAVTNGKLYSRSHTYEFEIYQVDLEPFDGGSAHISWLVYLRSWEYHEADFSVVVTKGFKYPNTFKVPATCKERGKANVWYCHTYLVKLSRGDRIEVLNSYLNTTTVINND